MGFCGFKNFLIDHSIVYLTLFNARSKNKLYNTEPIDKSMTNNVTAVFTLAHEIAHALFLLPDVYNHYNNCLMNNNAKFSRLKQTQILLKNHEPCPLCSKTVQGRLYEFKGDWLKANDNETEAIKYYEKAIITMPENLMIDYKIWYSTVENKIERTKKKLKRKKNYDK